MRVTFLICSTACVGGDMGIHGLGGGEQPRGILKGGASPLKTDLTQKHEYVKIDSGLTSNREEWASVEKISGFILQNVDNFTAGDISNINEFLLTVPQGTLEEKTIKELNNLISRKNCT